MNIYASGVLHNLFIVSWFLLHILPMLILQLYKEFVKLRPLPEEIVSLYADFRLYIHGCAYTFSFPFFSAQHILCTKIS